MNLKEHANKLKTDIPVIFLALKDKDTPLIAKIFAGITVTYALSPIDLVPDFIPVLGYLDAEGLWKDGKPKRWYYAVPIVLFWIIILVLILKMVI